MALPRAETLEPLRGPRALSRGGENPTWKQLSGFGAAFPPGHCRQSTGRDKINASDLMVPRPLDTTCFVWLAVGGLFLSFFLTFGIPGTRVLPERWDERRAPPPHALEQNW